MHLSEFAHRWWQRHSSLRELDALGGDTLRELAEDVAVQEADLYNLVARKNASEGLLSRLLGTFGLDADELSRNLPAVMHDMAVVCSGCSMTRRCRRELNGEQAKLNYSRYCSNAGTILTLPPGVPSV